MRNLKNLFVFLCILSVMGCKQKPTMQKVLDREVTDALIGGKQEPSMQQVLDREVTDAGTGTYLRKDSTGLVFCYVDSQRITFNDEYLDDGAMAMMLNPNGRYAYVVGDIVPNSNGWTVRFHLYRLDTQTHETKHIGNFAAIHFENDGFKAATTRLTNPDATCTADEVFAIHDVYFNYDGQQIRESKNEYRYDEMERIYSDSLVNANGFRY